ncbi:MAG: hypothetical protein ACRBBR_12735 [Cellvibrionaceae bacterium]
MGSNTSAETLLKNFCIKQSLPVHYHALATQYFIPLADEINTLATGKTTLLVGINGSQGSGKSTLAAFLEQLLTKTYNRTVANLSIDDFYHTKEYRQKLALNKHPLFKTRGVPGTHDTELLKQTLFDLQQHQGVTAIPRFDKATDNRCPNSQWSQIKTPVDIILLEGWCIGVTAQDSNSLSKAVNMLEEKEDSEGHWRKEINTLIDKEYRALFSNIDHLIMLKAPDFQCVYQWRQKQEDKLRQSHNAQNNESSTANIMNTTELQRFIEHYQRLTEHMLCYLPKQADVVFELDYQHQIAKRINNGNTSRS